MEISSAEFISSNTDPKLCPPPVYPEYAFTGRSNVGKSSLINYLTNRKGLAKTSTTPGKTQLINHFLINKNWYIADLPGYGYARLSKLKKADLTRIINDYLALRPNLVCVFVLIDSRHKLQKIDANFINWLGSNGIPFKIIFTKADKLSQPVLQKNINNIFKELKKEWEVLPDYFITSSEKKTGRKEVLDFIYETNVKEMRSYKL